MNLNFRADLHCHSVYSDGSDFPETLIELAQEVDLQGISITDHDTIAAYERALSYAKEREFLLLPGVEFSAFHRSEPVHVLGYAFIVEHPEILSFCKKHQERRKERNQSILRNLEKMGISISLDELYENSSGTVGRPHIAHLLMKRGIITDIKEGFQKFLGEGKPAYDPGQRISVEETINCIHRANGKVVLAHPHLLKKSTTIRDLLKMPFDGIEGYYARIPLEREKQWIDIGIQKGWIVTGGSDYHGSTKPTSVLGSSWVRSDTFYRLYDHYNSQLSL